MLRITLIVLTLLVVVVAVVVALILRGPTKDPFTVLYAVECSTCHGLDLLGTPTLGPPLLGGELQHGDSVAELHRSISEGYPERGMPAWSASLDDAEIQSLAIYIAERRVDRLFIDFKVDQPLQIPSGTVTSEEHNFRIEMVASGLHPLPFSIAPLPDGSILVTEKTQGLRVVSASGELSPLVLGTPRVYDDAIDIGPLEYGLGWLLDIAPHPDYAENGWIYLHFTDRCEDCDGLLPVSMNTLMRGRIRDGTWIDQEIIWSVDHNYYSVVPDIGAGGRLAFDGAGHVFLSVGVKGGSNYHGIQDITTPYGKIHRLHDDGRVPVDNPFLAIESAYPTTWTYGHRSPQGLEFNHLTGQLWGTEMGPRGGDELNLLLPGKNYGWPLTSKGLDYDGSPVEYGKDLGIEFDLEDIQQPVVDFTPSPAISSFIFYDGERFPGWRNNVIVGSLKATELYRVVLEDNKMVHSETLLKNLARIRDVETGPDGNIYLLLEHGEGGQIVRLVPAP
jgi:glucose/arabinose dehydrogenase/cytochrome c553